MTADNRTKNFWRLDRIIYLPVIISLVIISIVFTRISLIERETILERAKLQLEMMISTLADFNEFAEKNASSNAAKKDVQRNVIWNALLHYPTAKIWVVSHGKVISGQALTNDIEAYITTETDREEFVIHAALRKDDVLADWHKDVLSRLGLSSFVAIIFLILTEFLSRALRQRSVAEDNLKTAHLLLKEELISKEIAQAELRQHDALLNAVTQVAAELLDTQNNEEAIKEVLAVIGKTIKVSWIHLNVIHPKQSNESYLSSIRYEWNDAGVPAMINDMNFQNLNLAYEFSHLVTTKQRSEPVSFYTENLTPAVQTLLLKMNMRSFLYIPLIVDNRLWGSLHFIDTNQSNRQWSWAETDTLKIFAGLISVTISQMRYINELANANRRAGMAQIANDVLHNVGNALNSANVSANLITNTLQQSGMSAFGKAVAIFREHESDIGNYISTDERGKKLPQFIVKLYEHLLVEHEENIKELQLLAASIERINNIVSRQQAYAGSTAVQEIVNIKNIVEEGLSFCEAGFQKSNIMISRELTETPNAKLDKHRVLQIVVNLLTNAINACNESNQANKQVILRLSANDTHLIFEVVDNGVGIAPENIEKIFFQGFTTREQGHGLGLHNSIISAKEMGGKLTAQSKGLNCGASFTLVLPLVPKLEEESQPQ